LLNLERRSLPRVLGPRATFGVPASIPDEPLPLPGKRKLLVDVIAQLDLNIRLVFEGDIVKHNSKFARHCWTALQ